MGDRSAIEWTDATWNPTTGCTKVSPGCAHCYIERTIPFRTAKRRFVNGNIPLLLHEERTEQPLHWRAPRRIFVNSLSDLFHKDVPDAFLHAVYHTMEAAHWHQFQILTKRAERMRAYLTWRYGPDAETPRGRIPSRHIWHGVSVENQRTANERLPILLTTPSAVRFISAEPLLGMTNLAQWLFGECADCGTVAAACEGLRRVHRACCPDCRHRRLDWVIVGGESGPKARQFDLAWARALVAQCQHARVPVFVKQLGSNPAPLRVEAGSVRERLWLNDTKGGDITEWPADLRVREFPSLCTV